MQLTDRYHEALSMQRHYDALSQVAITGIAAVTAGTPVLYKSLGLPVAGLVFFAAIPLLYIAMKIYEGCDAHAAYALKVAGLYEEFDGPISKPIIINGLNFHGPAHGFTRRNVYDMETQAGGRFHSMVKRFFLGAAASFAVLGCASLYYDLVKVPSLAESKVCEAKAQAMPTHPSLGTLSGSGVSKP